MIKRNSGFNRLVEKQFQISASDGLIVGRVLDVGLYRVLQGCATNDGLKAQPIHLLEEIVLDARPVASAFVKNGQIEQAQFPAFPEPSVPSASAWIECAKTMPPQAIDQAEEPPIAPSAARI
jgi:hypothetical protein